MIDKVRSCDQFGATVNLNFKGETEYKTMCGGCFSLALRMLILAFFCMQLAAVIQYDDPKILSYQVMEDRSQMDEQFTLSDYKMNLYLNFVRSG